MPLFTKALILFLVTIAAMLLSPATLALALWVVGPGAPLVGVFVVAASACLAIKTAVSLRAAR